MSSNITRTILGCGLALAIVSPGLAETVKTSGTVCWTGTMEYIGSTKKDMGWHWNIDWIFNSDDKDMSKTSTGKCFGTGGMINGVPEAVPYFCINNQQDGGKVMTRGVGGPKGNKFTYFGGIGSMAGASGGITGGPETKLPADEGKLAACRHVEGEYTVGG